MQQLHSALWVNTLGSEEFSGVLTWVTPSALFRVGATSRNLCSALSTAAAVSYCQKMCYLKPEDWVYIDDLTSVKYNRRYAQVLGPQGSSGSKSRRYECAIYGVQGKKMYDRYEHQQTFRAVSLSVGNLFKVQTTKAAVRIYADGEKHPADAVQIKGVWFGFSHVANVQIPVGLVGCIEQANKCPSMKDTSMPLMLQDVEMLTAGPQTCILASHLKMPAIYHNWDGGDSDRYWMDHAGPQLVFRADDANFFVEDLLFVRDFMKFVAIRADELMDRGGFSELFMPSLLNEFEAEDKHRNPASPHEIQYFQSPAHIDEEIAAVAADIGWAEHVENRIHADLVSQSDTESHEPASHADQAAAGGVPVAEKINLLRIGSPPKTGDSVEAFRQILLHGNHLQMCRNALEEKGLSFVLPQQALMVVTPEQYADARHALKGTELHPFHLIVAEQFDYLIEEVLADIPYKRRPRVKNGNAGRQELAVLPRSTPMESDGGDSAEEGTSSKTLAEKSSSPETSPQYQTFVESRTFLCEAPVLKSNASVSCQSTTEVRVDEQQSKRHYGYHRGFNPRRFA